MNIDLKVFYCYFCNTVGRIPFLVASSARSGQRACLPTHGLVALTSDTHNDGVDSNSTVVVATVIVLKMVSIL